MRFDYGYLSDRASAYADIPGLPLLPRDVALLEIVLSQVDARWLWTSDGVTVSDSEYDIVSAYVDDLLRRILARTDESYMEIRLTGGNYSTTSTSFIDVDGTNAVLTVTTGGGPVLVNVGAVVLNTTAGGNVCLDLLVDNVRRGEDCGLMIATTRAAGARHPAAFSHLMALSAGEHTIKLQWRVDAGQGYLLASTDDVPLSLSAVEVG